MKKHIPNLFTLGNLLAGCIGVFYAVNDNLIMAGLLVLLGIFLDFFDGYFARLLRVPSELGKQLDSLADMVTSGVVPGAILVMMIDDALSTNSLNIGHFELKIFQEVEPLALIGFIFTLGAAYRLANFNIDERQSSSFIGLPTPAATLLVVSLPLIIEHSEINWLIELISNQWFLIVITGGLCYLMNANIPLFSLKFKEYSWRGNKMKYIFLLLSILLILFLKYVSIPLIILSYVMLSVVENKRSE